jgi:hypothetical protein
MISVRHERQERQEKDIQTNIPTIKNESGFVRHKLNIFGVMIHVHEAI